MPALTMSGILLQQIRDACRGRLPADGIKGREEFVMETRVIIWQETAPDCVKEAADCLRRGGLVAFPTETVYGLGGDCMNPEASGRIYAAKGRPSDNPLIIHIADEMAVEHLASHISEAAWKLMDTFWPGPLTLVLKKQEQIPLQITGGLDTVAVRMPSHPAALELIRQAGVYVAAPSANTSGRPSPSKAEHVYEDLRGKIDYIIDGGEVDIGIESTIIDMTASVPMILRPGYITPEMLERVIGHVESDPSMAGADRAVPPKAPGMKYTHYAPRGELTIVEGEPAAVVDKINSLVADRRAAGYKTGVLTTAEQGDRYRADLVLAMGKRSELITVSARLYSCLREFDTQGVEYMYAESFAGDSLGNAIMNRLLKAAGHKVIITGGEPV